LKFGEYEIFIIDDDLDPDLMPARLKTRRAAQEQATAPEYVRAGPG
jgi:hypothetical protein